MNETALSTVEPQELTVAQVMNQVGLVQDLTAQAMTKGQHYGTIPGCGPKPTLLKPGAEKLCLMFRLAPSFAITIDKLADDHREYRVKCDLTHITTERFTGSGVGSCSTKEAKYRYRWIGKGERRRKVERTDIADQWNTCLKMAKKRALVDAILTATAASDSFTQDVEDMRPSNASQPERRVQAELVDTSTVQAPVGDSATITEAQKKTIWRTAFTEYGRANGIQGKLDDEQRKALFAIMGKLVKSVAPEASKVTDLPESEFQTLIDKINAEFN